MSERTLGMLLLLVGAVLAIEGFIGLVIPDKLGLFYGVERVCSTTSVRVFAGNSMIVGLLLMVISRAPRGQGLLVVFASALCAGTAIVWFHSSATVIGVPEAQRNGELLQGGVALVLGLALAWGAVRGRALLSLPDRRTAAATASGWLRTASVRAALVLFGLMFVMTGLKGLLTPHDNALGQGIPYGLLWSVTYGRQIGFAFALCGAGLLYSAWNPRGSGLFVLAFALILSKTFLVIAVGARVIAMPVVVYEASISGALMLASMCMLIWIVRLGGSDLFAPPAVARAASR